MGWIQRSPNPFSSSDLCALCVDEGAREARGAGRAAGRPEAPEGG
jgi:hypothetical protein